MKAFTRMKTRVLKKEIRLKFWRLLKLYSTLFH
jgi:hypothetical protein